MANGLNTTQVEQLTGENTEYTTVEANEGGVATSLGLNVQLFAFQLLNFAIVAVVLWFLILKPLVKKMEERKKIIDNSLDKAKEVETKLQMSEQVYQEKIDQAKVEANKVIEEGHQKAMELVEEMKENAKVEIGQLVKQAKSKIEAEKVAMVEGVKNNATELVMLVAEKVLMEKLDTKKDKAFIEKTLKDLKQ
jgi:F-type H+-transporting ATPase subunit b